MAKRNVLMSVNGVVTLEVPRYNKPVVVSLPCRIVGNRLYTMTRTFCLVTLQKIAGAAGDADCKLISYTTVNG
jgi:hypothetical protein